VGLRRSTKKADAEFSCGYGQERFLWALISACGIFFLGTVVNIYYGASAFFRESGEATFGIAIVILLVSLVIESFTLWLAWRELRERHPGKIPRSDRGGRSGSSRSFVRRFGGGLGRSPRARKYGTHRGDRLARVGCRRFHRDRSVLGIIAVVLINKNREFLIAKRIPLRKKERIVEILESDPAIERVIDFKSAVVGHGASRIECEVEWNGTALLRKAFQGTTMREEWDEI
jgi:zinc transporter 9